MHKAYHRQEHLASRCQILSSCVSLEKPVDLLLIQCCRVCDHHLHRHQPSPTKTNSSLLNCRSVMRHLCGVFLNFFQIRILKNCHKWCKRLRFSFAVTLLLWSPYVIGQTIIFLPCDFYLLSSSSFFSSPNLGGRRLDVYHTSTHGVALVRI